MKVMYYVLIISILVFSNKSFADEITIFYNNGQSISDENIVKKNGHSLKYLRMDLIEDLEKEASKRANETHKFLLDEVTEEHGLQALMLMSEQKRNDIVMQKFKNSGIDLLHSEMTQEHINDVKKATDILQYASNQGVTAEMLPAIIFKGNLYRNVTNFTFLFKKKVK